MSFLNIFLLLFYTIFVGYMLYHLYLWIERKWAATYITAEALRELMPKVQLFDVREKGAFDRSHILGARNLPYTQLKQRYKEIRLDQPVYLYDDVMLYSGKTAAKLKRLGYKDIYILKQGFNSWNGKVKHKK